MLNDILLVMLETTDILIFIALVLLFISFTYIFFKQKEEWKRCVQY